jgi:hypothetical protein
VYYRFIMPINQKKELENAKRLLENADAVLVVTGQE